MQRLGRRSMLGAQDPFRFGPYTVRPAAGELDTPDGTRHLEPRVMDVLVCLARRAGEVVSREELIERVWAGRIVVDDAVTRCIRELRLALGDSRAQPTCIETIPKRGYRLLQPAEPLSAPHDPAATTPRTLAVLPFQNLSGDPGKAYLADGVTELLIANLAMLKELRVISRTSVMRYRNHDGALRSIAGELGADLVIEGSVLLAGDRVQVVVQLIEASTDVHCWSEQYLQPLGDLLDLQNRITRAVARHISIAISGAESQRLERRDVVDPRVMEEYLRGQWFLSRRSAQDCESAIRSFDAAVQVAPGFAKAWAALAMAWLVRALYGGGPPIGSMECVEKCSGIALGLDADLADAHSALGIRRLFYDWDLDGARDCLRRASALNPSHSLTHLGMGDADLAEGRFDSALQHLQTALDISPLDLGLNMNRGDFLISAGRYGSAVEQLQRTLELDPAFWPARFRLAHALALDERVADARVQLDGTAPQALRAKFLETEALVAGLGGERADARRAAAELEQLASRQYTSPWLRARAHASAGDVDAAFERLDDCLAERNSSIVFLRVNPVFHFMRNDPRFGTVLAKIRPPAREMAPPQ
jgi:TolB-like protein